MALVRSTRNTMEEEEHHPHVPWSLSVWTEKKRDPTAFKLWFLRREVWALRTRNDMIDEWIAEKKYLIRG